MDLCEALRPLRWAAYKVMLRTEGHLQLPPYKGSVLRGAFGATFKRLICVMPHRNCDICLLRQQCVYALDFETPAQIEGAKNAYAPHPFVIQPPAETRQDYGPGEELAFGVVLIGRAVEHLPYFIYTFEEMGKAGIGRGRGPARVEGVWHVSLDGKQKLIYDGAGKRLNTDWPTASGADLNREVHSPSVTLDFQSPTRMRVRNDLLIDLDFETLVRALLRRVSALSQRHCGAEMGLDYRGLVQRAKEVRIAQRALRWYDWERYSARQKTTMKLGGFVGQITFEGELEAFMPLLRIGSYLHVGKGTAFGLGSYTLLNGEGQNYIGERL